MLFRPGARRSIFKVQTAFKQRYVATYIRFQDIDKESLSGKNARPPVVCKCL
jgi:hypothetical protein